MVGPIGVEDTQFGLRRVALLLAEIRHHLGEVIGIHRQPPLLAESVQLGAAACLAYCHLRETREVCQGLHIGSLVLRQLRQVFLAALHGIDIVVTNAAQVGIRQVVIEDKQTAGAYLHLRRRVYQVHAVHRRRSTLVELPGDILHGKIFLTLQRATI